MSERRNELVFPLRGNNFEDTLDEGVMQAAAGSGDIASLLGKAAEPAAAPAPQVNTAAEKAPEMRAVPPPQGAFTEPSGFRPRTGRIAAAAVIALVVLGGGTFLAVRHFGGSDDSSSTVHSMGVEMMTMTTDEEPPTAGITDAPETEITSAEAYEFTTEEYTGELTEPPTPGDGEEDFMTLSPAVYECLGQLQLTAKRSNYTATPDPGKKLSLIAETLDRLKESGHITYRTEDLSGEYLTFEFRNGYKCAWGIGCVNDDGNYTKFSEEAFNDAENRNALRNGERMLYFCESGCYILTEYDVYAANQNFV